MERVKVSKELTIYHRLFIDNVGIFIPADEQSSQKLQVALRIYKLALGAKLNLAKSIIVPLAMTTIFKWLQNTGCTISKPREVQKYLGPHLGTISNSWTCITSI